MSPLYAHRQIAWPTVIAAGAASAMLIGGLAMAQLGFALPAILALIPLTVLLAFGWMTVRVFTDRMEVFFGLGLPRFTIDLREARSYRIVRNPVYYGWGIRLIPGGVMYNASGLDAVELRLDGGRVIRIGTDEPQKLAAALTPMLPEDGFIRQPESSALPWLAIAIPVLFFVAGLIVASSVTCGRVQATAESQTSIDHTRSENSNGVGCLFPELEKDTRPHFCFVGGEAGGTATIRVID